MARYLEINDENAALSAASELSSLGTRLDDSSLPPSVEWGDDRFGAAMLESYHKDNVPVDAMAEKPTLAKALTKLGDGTTGAVTDASNQDFLNLVDINEVQPPTTV